MLGILYSDPKTRGTLWGGYPTAKTVGGFQGGSHGLELQGDGP